MKHLTLSLPRRVLRKAARRALAGVLCATMLGGAAAIAADEGETIIAPGFDIAGTGFDQPDIKVGHIYYWRDAANGGIPTEEDKYTEIPILITWNGFYLCGNWDFLNKVLGYAPTTRGGNTAAHIPYGDLYGEDDFDWSDFEGIDEVLSHYFQYVLRHDDDQGRNDLWMGQLKYTSNDHKIGEDVSCTGVDWDDDEYDYIWPMSLLKDQTWSYDSSHGYKLGGPGFYYHYRHYPMNADALLGNLGIYNDLLTTGTAVTPNIPANVPFLLDYGKPEGETMRRYAMGFRIKEGDTPYFLYGSFFLRSSNIFTLDNLNAIEDGEQYPEETLKGHREELPGSSSQNPTRWGSTGDWFIYATQYTKEQWASENLNLKYYRGSDVSNTEYNQRTWTFDMTPSGGFTIGTDGAPSNQRMGNFYSPSDYSNDRLLGLIREDKIHTVSEGWLYHGYNGDTESNWLRYWGGDQNEKSHAGLANEASYIFKVYVGVPQKTNFIKNDFVVQAGQTVSLDGPIVLDNNRRITVEDGGVLSVSGWMMNNGTIEIKPGGTLVVQHRETPQGDYQEGLIDSVGKTTSEGGAILCDGTMIVMSNATVIGAGKYGLQFGDSAQVVNYGTLAAENFEVYRDHTIENRGDTSRVFCGWGVTGTGYGLTRVKNDGGSTYTDMARNEGASVVRLAANAVYGPRASAVHLNSASAVSKTQNMANRSGRVTSGGASGATQQKIAARVVDFDPAEWEKHYFLVPKKVKV